MKNTQEQPIYILVDLQNLDDNSEKTLDEAKVFLGNHWDELEEDDPFFEEIDKADFDELDAMLAGIDYGLFKNIDEVIKLKNNLLLVKQTKTI